MAIALDTTSTKTNDVVSSSTHSHTCTGSNLTLVVVITTYSATDANSVVDSCTYNGVAMTKQDEPVVAHNRVTTFVLKNPSTGANNVVATLHGSVDNCDVGAISLTGTDQTTQPDSHNGTTHLATDPETVSVTTVADNCWLVSVCQFNNNGSGSPGGGQTQFLNLHAGFNVASYSGPATPAGSKTHSYSNGTADDAALAIVAIQPTATTVTVKTLAALGVG